MNCPPSSDRVFGPRILPSCRSFDFTLQFEDIFFACLPAAVFIVLSIGYSVLLSRLPAVYSIRSKLFGAKFAAFVSLFALQLALLAVRTHEHASQSNASLAADILTSIAILAASILSTLSYQRGPRPSTILSLYLSAFVLTGIVRTRTLWLVFHTVNEVHAAASLNTAVLALFTVLLVLDCAEKKQSTPASTANTATYEKLESPEQSSGIWARTAFTWLVSTFLKGYSSVISLEDLPPLDSKLDSTLLRDRLIITWDKYDHKDRFSLIRACISSNYASFFSPVIPRLCMSAFTFCQPFLISATLNYVDQKAPYKNYGRGLIGAWALVYLGQAISLSIYQYQSFRYAARLRGGLITLIYRRTLQTKSPDQGDITAVATMGTDVERIAINLRSIHAKWILVIEIGIACWLLERQMSLACLAPIAVVSVCIAATSTLSMTISRAQVTWIEKIQERLRVTSAMLGDMKAVKMLGLSPVILPVIQRLRTDEITTSQKFRKYFVATIMFSIAPTNLAPVLTFGVYTIIAVYWKSETLLTAQAFTSVSLISLLVAPVIGFIQNLPPLIQCLGNFERIQNYCNYYPGEPFDIQDETKDIKLSPLSNNSDPVHFEGQSFTWSKANGATVLKSITASFKRGSTTAIIGPVGSGKSSFLSAILGEMAIAPGAKSGVDRSQRYMKKNENMAYCGQQPWLQNGTIRQNILGASPWDPVWYTTVCRACCLRQDLDILPKGDQTSVGSKGVNLSGGQKQRITLARAVYSRLSVVILDDVFSGMDAHTSDSVFRSLLGTSGLLKSPHITVILTTNSSKIMSLVDSIIVLQDGRIAGTGRPEVLQHENEYIKTLGLSTSNKNLGTIEDSCEPGSSNKSIAVEFPEELQAQFGDEGQEKATDLRRKNGQMSVYSYYMRSSGFLAIGLYTATIIIWTVLSEFSTIWLSLWSDANEKHPNQNVGLYMGVYAVFGVLALASACFSAWSFFVSIISNSANKLHLDLLVATMKAPFRFFSNTDSGELLNRFSEDMALIDMDLPAAALNYTSNAFTCFVEVIILAVFSRVLAVSVPFVFVVLYILQRFYLQTSRQMRLLMIEAKAPLYTHFSEAESTATPSVRGKEAGKDDNSDDSSGGGGSGSGAGPESAGAVTIRAFGWEAFYEARAAALVNQSQRPAYMQECVQQWLSFVLAMVMTALIIVLVASVVTWKDQLKIYAGGVGVALTVILSLNITLTRLITEWTRLESCIGAVARVKRFFADTEKEDEGLEHDDLFQEGNPGPSSAGTIEFDNLVAAYRLDTEPVLKGLSLSVPSGEHMAICGRSGSGKTSLVLSLLRMMDVREGGINLDGIPIVGTGPASLSSEAVRSHFNVVPQDPFLLSGTSVRFNIDPLTQVSDNDLVDALQKVKIWDLVHSQGGLDVNVDLLPLSAGQKQLLCFARAIAHHSHRPQDVLVLDEATSSLDGESEALVQNIVETVFKGCTVLAVMHRLKHIRSYNRVVLMETGKLVEDGQPDALIAGNTKFAQLHRAHAA